MVNARKRFVRLMALLGVLLAQREKLRADVLIPSTGYVSGGNGADFRTDVRIFNPTGLPVLVTPVFYRQANPSAGIAAATVTQGSFTVPARGQVAFDNIIGDFFAEARGSFGPVRLQALSPVVVSSGTNNVNGCGNGSVSGQWIPGLDVSQAAPAGGRLVPLTRALQARPERLQADQ